MELTVLKMFPSVQKKIFIAVMLMFLGREVMGREAKYLVDLERFESCKEYPNIESPMTNVKFVKINRTARAFSFATDLKRPIDENIGMKAELEKWSLNSWIPIPFMSLQPDACNLFTKLLGNLWVDLKRNMGVKEPEKCPIPADHYEMNDYMYDTSDLGHFAPFKGKFRYKVILMDVKTEEPVQCIALVINVTDAV